jgi:mono/diheme cytochrome c family protein
MFMNVQLLYRKPVQLTVVILIAVIPSRHLLAQSKPWSVPKEYASLTNPLAGNQAALKDGKILYTANCSPCHGDKGKGDGPAAAALKPRPADHTSSLMLQETDGNIFYKISEGRTPMPQYKVTLTEKQRWELVTYIRTLSNGAK